MFRQSDEDTNITAPTLKFNHTPGIVYIQSRLRAETDFQTDFGASVDIAVCQDGKKRRFGPGFVFPQYWDPVGKSLLERMDEADIRASSAWTSGLLSANRRHQVRRTTAEFRDDNPDKITTFATIDPRRTGVAYVHRFYHWPTTVGTLRSGQTQKRTSSFVGARLPVDAVLFQTQQIYRPSFGQLAK